MNIDEVKPEKNILDEEEDFPFGEEKIKTALIKESILEAILAVSRIDRTDTRVFNKVLVDLLIKKSHAREEESLPHNTVMQNLTSTMLTIDIEDEALDILRKKKLCPGVVPETIERYQKRKSELGHHHVSSDILYEEFHDIAQLKYVMGIYLENHPELLLHAAGIKRGNS